MPTTVISSLSNHCSLSSDLHHISGRKAVLRRFTQRRESTSPGDPAVLVLSLTYKMPSGWSLSTSLQVQEEQRRRFLKCPCTHASQVPAPMHLPTAGFPPLSGPLHPLTPLQQGSVVTESRAPTPQRGVPVHRTPRSARKQGISGWTAQTAMRYQSLAFHKTQYFAHKF